ncbi:MAG: AAA family ATPase, partial [Acidobacteria bacterium]|nr:AAA family ATPase [Acidobacteriota bacterium]
MLRHLRISNFKAWKETGNLRLAPLTVFFGSNSSGKTSLMQLLLMLKQTAASPDRRQVIHRGDQNTPVELGTYQDLVFGHDEEKDLRFHLKWSLSKELRFKDPRTKQQYSGDALSLDVAVGKASENEGRLELRS